MMNEGMIYTLNREEAEKEVEKVRAKLTQDQLDAHSKIDSMDRDAEGQMASYFCILERVKKLDNCAYSMEAAKAMEEACYDAYMMGKASKVK